MDRPPSPFGPSAARERAAFVFGRRDTLLETTSSDRRSPSPKRPPHLKEAVQGPALPLSGAKVLHTDSQSPVDFYPAPGPQGSPPKPVKREVQVVPGG
jgi:hypothetical protein